MLNLQKIIESYSFKFAYSGIEIERFGTATGTPLN